MNNTFFYDNFHFFNITFSNYHYNDARAGCPMNYLAKLVRGNAKIIIDNKTIYINEGDVFYIPKGLPYQSYWYGEKINFVSIGFHELLAKEGTSYDLQIIPCKKSLSDKISQIPTTGTKISCKALSIFYEVMSELIPLLLPANENNEEVISKKIKSCIRNNPHLSLSKIADMCSISEPYLYSVFKKAIHTTPNDFRQKVICNMGVELLLTTDKRIEEISSMLNFSSSSYFRKILKKHTGKTPREIRKSRGF